jgi:hypothetical protein
VEIVTLQGAQETFFEFDQRLYGNDVGKTRSPRDGGQVGPTGRCRRRIAGGLAAFLVEGNKTIWIWCNVTIVLPNCMKFGKMIISDA